LSDSRGVAEYYDRNTSRFLRVGRSGEAHAIHRQLWGPGVTTPAGAAGHIHTILADALRAALPTPPYALVDLGCGVGGTVLHLARAFPTARVHGLTISPRQVEIGRNLVARHALGNRCSLHLGDFESAGLDATTLGLPAPADAVVAIESSVHAGSTERFLASAHRLLRPGGILLVVDDFVAREPDALDEGERRCVDRFIRGWRIPSLGSVARLIRLAEGAGFAALSPSPGLPWGPMLDLTPLIRTGRPRDRLIRLAAPIFEGARLSGVPFFGNMIGGDALQRGLDSGLIRYTLMAFVRPGGEVGLNTP